MRIKVSYQTEKTIEKCYHECPYFGLDGGPSPTMQCEHPDTIKKMKEEADVYAGYIISHPECDEGFPKECPLLKKKIKDDKNCIHNHRCRYIDGFHCEDCDTFFLKDSPTYRSDELLSSIWMVLNNINVDFLRKGEQEKKEITQMMDKIGIGIKHDNYEEIIAEAEIIMSKYGKNSNSASHILERKYCRGLNVLGKKR